MQHKRPNLSEIVPSDGQEAYYKWLWQLGCDLWFTTISPNQTRNPQYVSIFSHWTLNWNDAMDSPGWWTSSPPLETEIVVGCFPSAVWVFISPAAAFKLFIYLFFIWHDWSQSCCVWVFFCFFRSKWRNESSQSPSVIFCPYKESTCGGDIIFFWVVCPLLTPPLPPPCHPPTPLVSGCFKPPCRCTLVWLYSCTLMRRSIRPARHVCCCHYWHVLCDAAGRKNKCSLTSHNHVSLQNPTPCLFFFIFNKCFDAAQGIMYRLQCSY